MIPCQILSTIADSPSPWTVVSLSLSFSLPQRCEAREHDNSVRQFVAHMGYNMPHRQHNAPVHAYLENLNEWHQQEYGVSFITPYDEEEFVDDGSFQSAPTPCVVPGDHRPSSSAPPPPFQGPSSFAQPPAEDPPRESFLQKTGLILYFHHILLLLVLMVVLADGELASLLLLVFGAKKREKYVEEEDYD